MNLKIIIPPTWNPDNPENFNKWMDKIYKHLPAEKRIEVLRHMPWAVAELKRLTIELLTLASSTKPKLIMFGTKKKVKWNDHKLFIPPPPPKEVAKIREMLKQVEFWINSGEKELAEKHWMLIADECRKYGT